MRMRLRVSRQMDASCISCGATASAVEPAANEAAASERPQTAAPPRPITIDWPGLERRTRQVTRMPFAISSFIVAPDSRTLAFVTTEPAGARTQPVIYTVQHDGRQ